MSAQALIRDFEAHGARFELRSDGVHLVRPKGTVLPPELIEAARARKAEIQEALNGRENPTLDPPMLARFSTLPIMPSVPRSWKPTRGCLANGLIRLRQYRRRPLQEISRLSNGKTL